MQMIDCTVHTTMSGFSDEIRAGREGPSVLKGVIASSKGKATPSKVFGRLFFMVTNEVGYEQKGFAYFSVDDRLTYSGFCDDFGPMSLGTVYEFCNIVDGECKTHAGPVVMKTRDEKQQLTNSIFLLGSYLIMKMDMEPSEARTRLSQFMPFLAAYRDVSPGPQNFDLHVMDCWNGLWRAKTLKWVDFSRFNHPEYVHYDNPLNGDLHVIIPGKIVAFRGPKELPDEKTWHDVYDDCGNFRYRDFSPAFFCHCIQAIQCQCFGAPQ
mmetsp:Transcript_33273/g.88348  ORF Transcript_33273/g.88348 Transcript_33273/m.88348 type:complete len:266 (+) Transcript_33273:128-925(+)